MTLSSWKEHYWHGVNCTRSRIEEIVKRAKSMKAYKVLEVGCNEGFLSQALIESGFHVTSIDNDPTMVARAKDVFGINAMLEDANDLPFMDGEFDLVVGGEVMEHLVNPGKGLSEMFRVSNNRVIISIPIGEYWLGESTHRWQIESTVVEHDEGLKTELDKKILIIEFIKRKQ